MGVSIAGKIFDLPGQCIESITLDEERNVVRITTRRDRRIKPIDACMGRTGSTNRILRRVIEDLPICGKRSEVEIEYIEVFISRNNRRVEKLEFTVKMGVIQLWVTRQTYIMRFDKWIKYGQTYNIPNTL